MSPKSSSKIREYAESLGIAFILAMIIRCFVLEAFKIPTGSMEPTLRGDPSEGDRILVSKLYYSAHDPQRWDIFVFYCPDKPEKHYIKRLGGKPGETIRIYNGDLYVNGEIARKPEEIQQTMWRKLADERILAATELLYRLNGARRELGGQHGALGVNSWLTLADMVECQEQLRLVENGAPTDGIYRRAARRAESLVAKNWSSMEYRGKGLAEMRRAFSRRQFERWYARWLGIRREIEPKIESLNKQYAANQGSLLQRALEKAWKNRGFNVNKDGGMVAVDDAATATYRRKIADGRFNDHIEFITENQAIWGLRKIGTGRNRVGDVKVEFDLSVPAKEGATASVTTIGNGLEFMFRVRVLGAAPGGEGTAFAFELTRDGEKVDGTTQSVRLGPESNLHVTIANVDKMYTAAIAGQAAALRNAYADLELAEGQPSSIRLEASKGVVVDNVEIWRDVYYTNMGPRSMPGKQAWGRDGVYALGDNEYLALGDNSPDSRDSRDWGPVPHENVVGKAFFILTPIGRIGFLR